MSESLDARGTLPYELLRPFVVGNNELPQMQAGMILRTGADASQMVLDGRTTWDAVTTAITPEQLERLARAANNAHAKHGIRRKFLLSHVETGDASGVAPAEDYGARLIRVDAMPVVFEKTAAGIVRTASDYAAAMIPAPSPDGTRYYESDDYSTIPIHPQHRQLVNTLFAEHQPEARALTELWRAAADSLSTDEAKNLSTQLQVAIREAQDDEDQIALTTRQAMRYLEPIVRAGITEQLPHIESALGRSLPNEVIDTFVSNTVYEQSDILIKT